jgi:hypothetical protein
MTSLVSRVVPLPEASPAVRRGLGHRALPRLHRTLLLYTDLGELTLMLYKLPTHIILLLVLNFDEI